MSTSETPTINPNPVPIAKDEDTTGKKRVVDWQVQFSIENPDEVERLKVLLVLLKTINDHDFEDGQITTSLKFKWFKCEGEEQFYDFLVFRETKEGPSETEADDSDLESLKETPTRTPGPPTTPPPSVSAVLVRTIFDE